MNIKIHDARVSFRDLAAFPIFHAHALLNTSAFFLARGTSRERVLLFAYCVCEC